MMYNTGASHKTIKSGLQVDPYTKLLVLNGYSGTLQYYDPFLDRTGHVHTIVPSDNAIVGYQGKLVLPQVTNVCLGRDGSYLATVCTTNCCVHY